MQLISLKPSNNQPQNHSIPRNKKMDPIPNLPPRKLRSNLSVQIQVPNDKLLDDCDDDDDIYNPDLYSSDEFRIYDFKVRRCARARSHDWTDCPFAHPGEKARRRDPRSHHYSATVCPEYRSRGGHCPRGDTCEFAHGVFECWLHPARYRTTPCRDGKGCRRKVCFFAHTRKQLRAVPASSPSSPSSLFLSPTSTLVGFGCCSSATSPVSPAVGFGKSTRRREAFGELVSRLEAMEVSSPPPPARTMGLMSAVSECGNTSSSWYAPDFEWVDELLE